MLLFPSLIFCQLSCFKLPLIESLAYTRGLRRAYKQGQGGGGGKGLISGEAYNRTKNKRFKTSYIRFEVTRNLNLQNVVEIRILISMQARSRVLSSIYCLEGKFRVAEGHEFPGRVRGHAPGNFLK